MHFQAPIRLPEHVSVQVVVVKVSVVYIVSGSRRSAHFVFIWAETRGDPSDRPRDERADEHHRVRAGALASRCLTQRQFQTPPPFPVFFRMMMGRFGESQTHFHLKQNPLKACLYSDSVQTDIKKAASDGLCESFVHPNREGRLRHAAGSRPRQAECGEDGNVPFKLSDGGNVWTGNNRC